MKVEPRDEQSLIAVHESYGCADGYRARIVDRNTEAGLDLVQNTFFHQAQSIWVYPNSDVTFYENMYYSGSSLRAITDSEGKCYTKNDFALLKYSGWIP